MKIKKIEYENKEYKWRFKPIVFNSGLTLLVGISGVGKTQILQSIYNLKKIANGASFNGVKWHIEFTDDQQQEYCWSGEFEIKRQGSLLSKIDEKENNFNLVQEKLSIEQDTVFERQNNNIFFRRQKTPKLASNISTVELLSEEEAIARVKKAFDRILLSSQEHERPRVNFTLNDLFKILERFKDSRFSGIQNSHFPLDIKLLLTYRYHKNIFDKIKSDFIDIFPFVEDIRMQLGEKKIPIIPVESSLRDLRQISELRQISIKEKNVDSWIKQANISAGMLKSFMYIAEVYLLPQGSVVLIDEFENSLGVNCIDGITDNLLDSDDLQFIITSHHPYIINNITPRNWKIVTRKGGVVETIDASDLGISNSRHKAFIELNNYLQKYDEKM